MSYTLERWDVLIHKTIHPDNLLPVADQPDVLASYRDNLVPEKEATRLLLVRDFERGASEERMEFLVQFNQGILIRLLDRLYFYQHWPALPTALVVFYEAVAVVASSLLDFIEEYFIRWLDPHVKIPLQYLPTAIEFMQHQVRDLQQRYANEKALPIVLHHFNFDQWKEQSITYAELMYDRLLLHELLSDRYAIGYSFEDRLIRINFNSFEFLHYLLAALQLHLETIPLAGSSSEWLASYQKRVRLLTEKPGAGLFPDYISVRHGLLQAIDEELAGVSFVAADADSPPMAADRSVHVPFKGTEIYLLHKSFIDSGGATGETYRSILEKTAPVLSNKHRKGFSVESLQKNSDKVDYASKENVKRFLMKMIRNVESY